MSCSKKYEEAIKKVVDEFYKDGTKYDLCRDILHLQEIIIILNLSKRCSKGKYFSDKQLTKEILPTLEHLRLRYVDFTLKTQELVESYKQANEEIKERRRTNDNAIFYNIDYNHKETAKKLGCQFSGTVKKWYILDNEANKSNIIQLERRFERCKIKYL